MADKPEKFPYWALEDEVDQVSGQLNVVEPPEQRFNSGWTRREIPPRQWMNWLLRKSALWFRWLEDRITRLDSLDESGDAPVYGVRAWGNLNGDATAVINASGNISSFSRSNQGEYSVTFAVPMIDEKYSVVGIGGGIGDYVFTVQQATAEGFDFFITDASAGSLVQADSATISFQVVR